MKKIIFLVYLSATLFACNSNDGDNPTTVTKNFMTAFSNKDYDKAATYATKESKTMIDLVKSLSEMGRQMGGEQGIDKTDAEKMKKAVYSDAVIDGEKATVKVTVDGETTEVKLKKEEGAWKVALDKDSFRETTGEKSAEVNQSLDEATKALEGASVDSIKNAINKAGEVLQNDSVRKALNAAGDALQKAGQVMKEVSKENQ